MDQRSYSATNDEDRKQRSSYEEPKDVEDDPSRESCPNSVPPPTIGHSFSVVAANENERKEVSSDETPEVDQENSKRCPSSPPLLTSSEDKVSCTLEEVIEVAVKFMAMAYAAAANKNEKKGVSSHEAGYEARFDPEDEEIQRFVTEKWPKCEPLIRHMIKVGCGTWVKQKVDIVLSSQSKVQEKGSSSRTLKWKLKFCNQPAPRMYEKDEIKSDTGGPLIIGLSNLDGDAFISKEQLPSIPLKFFLLDGECKEIMESRKGKPSPLISDDYPNNRLQDGICFVSRVIVTDNSSWTKTKEFYLGVKIVDEKFLDQYGMVEQAISKPFKVLAERGKGSEKHYPPRWDDEVSRLEGIKEDGAYHKILKENSINTVGEFLTACHGIGHMKMKEMLKMTKSEKKWNKILDHALSYYDGLIDYDQTVDVQANNDHLVGNEVQVNQQNNTHEVMTINEVEVNPDEVCEQNTNGDNELQTTSSFVELADAIGREGEASAPYDPRGYTTTLQHSHQLGSCEASPS